MSEQKPYWRATMDYGVMEVNLPDQVSPFDVDEMESLFALIVRQFRRRVSDHQAALAALTPKEKA